MKIYTAILFFFISFKSFSCICDDVNPIIEFKQSEYVFEGIIISKIYAEDNQTYKVLFEVIKHYKDNDFSTQMEFIIPSEGKYTGVFSSCDWSADLGQKWLVYVKKTNGILKFDAECSNTKMTSNRGIQASEMQKLIFGNSFKFDDFIFDDYEHFFNRCKNVSDILPILKKTKKKDYINTYTILIVSINKKGKLKKVFFSKNLWKKKDSIFDVITDLIDTKKYEMSDFDKDAIKLFKKVKKWEIKKFFKTNEPVNYVRYIRVEYDKENNEWKCSL